MNALLQPPRPPRWPGDARAACAFTVDLDADALWLARLDAIAAHARTALA